MTKLTNNNALITGASKGIGASNAKRLAAACATVIVNDATSRPAADKIVAEISDSKGNS